MVLAKHHIVCGLSAASNDATVPSMNDRIAYLNEDDQYLLPHFEEVTRPLPLQNGLEIGYKLLSLAKLCEGLSGRILRNLPEKSICLHTTAIPCPIGIAIAAAETSISVAKEDLSTAFA